MGLISAVTGTVEDGTVGVSGVETGTLSAFGIAEVTGILLIVALLYLTGYVNILKASSKIEQNRSQQLFGLTIPLFLAFAGIVIYHSLLALELITPP